MYFPFRKVLLILPFWVVSASVSAADLTGQSLPPLGADSGSVSVQPANDINSQLLFQVQQLQREVQMLRDHVEQQAQLINQLQRDSRDRYLDADRRLSDLSRDISVIRKRPANPALPPAVVPPDVNSTSPALVKQPADSVSPPAKPPAVNTTPVTMTAKQAYQKAYALVKAKDFDKAIEAYRGFISTYQDSSLVPNAWYWLGELYLVKKESEQAEKVFNTVVQSFPESRKVPDASYKLGLIYARSGQQDKAKEQMESVIKQYPDSTASKLAQRYLEQ